MELRWLEGNWKHGKFKLQYQTHQWDGKNPGSGSAWRDVPVVPEKKEKELWEKIWAFLQTHHYDTDCAAQEIAEISRKHFESSKP